MQRAEEETKSKGQVETQGWKAGGLGQEQPCHCYRRPRDRKAQRQGQEAVCRRMVPGNHSTWTNPERHRAEPGTLGIEPQQLPGGQGLPQGPDLREDWMPPLPPWILGVLGCRCCFPDMEDECVAQGVDTMGPQGSDRTLRDGESLRACMLPCGLLGTPTIPRLGCCEEQMGPDPLPSNLGSMQHWALLWLCWGLGVGRVPPTDLCPPGRLSPKTLTCWAQSPTIRSPGPGCPAGHGQCRAGK